MGNPNVAIVGQDASGVLRPVRVSGAGALTVVSGGGAPSVTNTRPADTTAYTAGDAVGGASSAIQEFTNVSPVAGGTVVILGATLRINVSSVPSGMANQRLHLYNAAPDAIADNAAWDLSSAGDRGKYLGFVDIGSPADLGSTIFAQADGINKSVTLAAGSTSLFGVRQTIAAYTPTSAAVSVITLNVVPA